MWAAHDFAASQIPGIFGAAVGYALQGISEVTEQGTGLNVKQLVDAERTLYQTLVPSRLGHVGGSPPIFQALADGQAAYVHLGKEDAVTEVAGDGLLRAAEWNLVDPCVQRQQRVLDLIGDTIHQLFGGVFGRGVSKFHQVR